MISFENEIYQRYFIIAFSPEECTIKSLTKHCKEWYKTEKDAHKKAVNAAKYLYEGVQKHIVNGNAGGLFDNYNRIDFICLQEFNLKDSWCHSILAHEVLHATFRIIRQTGAQLSSKSEETYCYLHQWIIRKIYRHLLHGQDNDSKDKSLAPKDTAGSIEDI